MKNDNSKPRREFPFVVIAEYGMALRNSALFCRTIGGLDKDAMVRNGDKCVKTISIMNLLMMEFAFGVRGTLHFSKPICPDELLDLPALNKVVKFDL